MVEDKYVLEIKPQFQKSLQEILDFIKANSYQNYERFRKDIVPRIAQIGENPLSFPLVKVLPTKRNIYRYASFKRSYNIYYRIIGHKVMILDIIHVRRNPKELKSLRNIK
jgi:plasmid stabilization system protein ParE